MSAYRSAFVLSKPEGNRPIPRSAFSYLRARNRLRAFNLLQNEFRLSGISQATLSGRMKKDPGQLSRLLNAPGNITLDTLSDLLFAISGAVPNYSAEHPLDKPARNLTKPVWAFKDTLAGLTTGGTTTVALRPKNDGR